MEEGASSSPKKNGGKYKKLFLSFGEGCFFPTFFPLSPTPNFPKLSSLLSPPEEKRGKIPECHRPPIVSLNTPGVQKKRIIRRRGDAHVGMWVFLVTLPTKLPPTQNKKTFPKEKTKLDSLGSLCNAQTRENERKKEKLGKLAAVQRIHFPTHF